VGSCRSGWLASCPGTELKEAEAKLEKTEAKLEKAEAKLEKAKVELKEAEAKLEKAKVELKEAKESKDSEEQKRAQRQFERAETAVDNAQRVVTFLTERLIGTRRHTANLLSELWRARSALSGVSTSSAVLLMLFSCFCLLGSAEGSVTSAGNTRLMCVSVCVFFHSICLCAWRPLNLVSC